MRVHVTGASGFIGSALVPALAAAGHEVVRLVRRPSRGPGERSWDPGRDLDPGVLVGADAVVHLAGASIDAGRWTRERKARILETRTGPTRRLADVIARGSSARTLICASGVGIYGDRGDEVLTESSAPGGGFLAHVVRDWEAAAEPARAAGKRVVHVRSGLVMGTQGGALAKMIPLFRFGLGGSLGSGRQWVSWIALADHVRVVMRALEDESLDGPINAVAPNPIPQRAFAQAIGRALRRPAFLPAPRWALRIVLGEMADELLLYSQRAVPARLSAAGHRFAFPEIDSAFAAVLRTREG
jgi:uncharacterized protein (TIGR01777 family)